MKFLLLASLAILASASPIAEPGLPLPTGGCLLTKCLLGLEYVDLHNLGDPLKDCIPFQKTTVTPCPTTKTTYSTSTVTVTKSCHKQANSPQDNLITQETPKPTCTPSTCHNSQPTYASSYCSGGEFASACSCLGLGPTTVTAPRSTHTTTLCGGTTTVTKSGWCPTSTPCKSKTTTKVSTKTPTKTVTSTTTATDTVTDVEGTSTTYDATSTSTVLIPTTFTTTTGAVTVTAPTPTDDLTCTDTVTATDTETSVTYTSTVIVTVTTPAPGNNAHTKKALVARSTSKGCGTITSTKTITGPASTKTVSSTATTTVTVDQTQTIDGGTTTTTTTTTGTVTVTIPSTVTVTPGSTSICITTETDTATTTTTTTIATDSTSTTTVQAAPTLCGNQGLRWAYYNNTFGDNVDATYSQYDPTVYKTESPVYQDFTTTIGGLEGGDQEEQISIYGSPTDLNSDFFTLNHVGYIVAPSTGTFTFKILTSDDITLAWIGPNAYSGWTRDNADVVANVNQGGMGSVQVDLVVGNYYAFRIIFGQAQTDLGFEAELDGPDGNAFLSSSSAGSPYIVQYSCDGTTAPPFAPFGQETRR